MTGFSTARQYMVDGQVRPSDVTDDRILEAMLSVPREVFVPASKQALAYLDLDLDVTDTLSAKLMGKVNIQFKTDYFKLDNFATMYADGGTAALAPAPGAAPAAGAAPRR